MRRSLELAVALALLASVSLQARIGSAQPAQDTSAEPDTRAEARQRFDRGLALYESADYTGALSEFQRAYELTHHPLVLYNVALVEAKLGDAVGAVHALEELKAGGFAQLDRGRAARAEQVYAEQLLRIGTVLVRCNVATLTAQIDNVDVDLRAPLRLTSGPHLLAIFAPGYAPRHIAFSVLGRAHKTMDVELTPIAESSSRVQVTSDVSDVEVRDAGQLLGKLPFHGPLMLAPGKHELEFSREGYAVERRSIVAPPGDGGTLHVPLRATVADGRLQLRLSEANAVVSVDGRPTLAGASGVELPRGRHALRVQRAGFFDVNREVVVPPAGATTVDVRLLPTPEYLAHYVDSAKRQRRTAVITGGSGLLTLAGAGAFLLWNQGQKNRAKRAFDDFANQVEALPGGSCNTPACDAELGVLLDSLEQKRHRDVYGWVGVGVGAAALGVGTLLYLLGDDPKRYEPRPESNVFGSLRLHLAARSLTLSGTY